MKIATFAVLLVLSSCSAGFNREWRHELASNGVSVTKLDLTGAWQGTWRSEVNGHAGELRCIVRRQHAAPCTIGEDSYRFHYHAAFMKILSASYEVAHLIKESKKGFTFSGDQAISGPGGGLYHYEGQGTPTQFRATYRSKFDRGVFELRRPAGL